MENVEIAEMLERVADLLEIREANPFRVRAYRNAARTVEFHTAPMERLVAEEADLTELPGIGQEMARHIRELVERGALTPYEELSREVPPSLIELMRLPGVGPKKARKVWQALGVETLDALEAEAKAGRIAELEGFGEKTQAQILAGIESYRRHVSRFRLGDVDPLVRTLLEHLRELPQVEQAEVAGSWRRRRETVGDLDLLAVATEPGPVMDRFTAFPSVATVLVTGDTRGSVRLRDGLQVDIRIVPPESYGAALVYFTGSKAHNIKLRQRALERALHVSEYGVFRAPEGGRAEGVEISSGELVAGRTEEEVYGAVELPWIPPELREDRGEIEAAERGTLPRLVTREDLRGDLQMHSTWSDGKNSIEEMLEACVRHGYEYFAITDHSQALAMTGGLDEKRLAEQWAEMEEIQARHDEIRILRSMEVDILRDGTLDLAEEMLAGLDLVVVSVHSYFNLPPEEQTERILRAIRHPEVNVLGHPTGRLINRRDPIRFEVEEILKVAAELGVAVEINSQPDRLDLKDAHAARARELGVKVVISTDAHRASELEFVRYGVEQARRAWLEPKDVLNALPLEGLLTALSGRT
ncbi:MAG: DNA polymerase/3'-5' exonuclease PolX [Gemmatimonadota bacterium]